MSLSLGFSDIKVGKEISAKSMDRLSKGQISIVDFDMKSSDMEQMMIRSELMVNNPSIFQVDISRSISVK